VKYLYRCAQCGGSVSKPPVSADKEGKFLHGLHGWKCAVHGPTSVTRSMAKKDEQVSG